MIVERQVPGEATLPGSGCVPVPSCARVRANGRGSGVRRSTSCFSFHPSLPPLFPLCLSFPPSPHLCILYLSKHRWVVSCCTYNALLDRWAPSPPRGTYEKTRTPALFVVLHPRRQRAGTEPKRKIMKHPVRGAIIGVLCCNTRTSAPNFHFPSYKYPTLVVPRVEDLQTRRCSVRQAASRGKVLYVEQSPPPDRVFDSTISTCRFAILVVYSPTHDILPGHARTCF